MRPAIPKKVRERVLNRFGGRCGYCGEKPSKLQIDHIVPFARHYYDPQSAHSESNLMPACQSCNNYKTTLGLETFRMQIADQLRMLRERSVNFRLAKRFGLLTENPKPVVFYFESEGG